MIRYWLPFLHDIDIDTGTGHWTLALDIGIGHWTLGYQS